jgi:hypothetical protein
MQLALIDVPGPGALENATPPEVFAGAAPAIGRTFRVVEEVSGGGLAGAAEAGDEGRKAGGSGKSAGQHRLQSFDDTITRLSVNDRSVNTAITLDASMDRRVHRTGHFRHKHGGGLVTAALMMLDQWRMDDTTHTPSPELPCLRHGLPRGS